jgi:hypothetical protein
MKKANYEAAPAREEGATKRPIGEWEAMMISIYDMVRAANSAE